jgi:hypothetical protein
LGKNSSWLTGLCQICDYPVVVTQPDPEITTFEDYQWYCSNPKCKNHSKKEHTGDMGEPEWVKF